jgi:molecular chaperone GrpE
MSDRAEKGPAEGRGQEEKVEEEEQPELEALRKELEAAKASNQKYLALAQRIQADFDNYRKRAQRDKEEFVKCANDKLLCELLVTLDDLERALAPGIGEEELRQGIEQVRCNLTALLRSYGLREMPSEERFDPGLHEALAVCEGEEGKIYDTYQKGYLLGNRVIRHAKVRVGKNKMEEDQNG